MNELLRLEKRYAHTYVEGAAAKLSDTVGSVRIYTDSPESVLLQIRTVGKLTHTRAGKTRRAYSAVSLKVAEIDEVVKALQEGKRKLIERQAASNPVQL